MNKPIIQDIWIVDDLETDHELLKISFAKHLDVSRIKSFYSAEEALEAINSGCIVNLIILDYKMPGIGGAGFLKAIEKQTTFSIPVIVLTSSNNPDDIQFAYQNGAYAYVSKPKNFDQFTELGDAFGNFWFKQVHLPNSI